MSFVYRPGNIVVDETSDFGQRAHPSPTGTPAWWSNTGPWLGRVRYWLDQIGRTGVGRTLLDSMEVRPPPGDVVVTIVRAPHDIYTDGIIAPNTGLNNTASPTIFVTYTPDDARSLPINMDPMRHPGAVLIHELMHAYMAIHDLNTIRTGSVFRNIAGWSSGPYPNHNEFLATTIQNMLLSEEHAVLADGYSIDDPWIESRQSQPIGTSAFGMSGVNRVDMANFVREYRQPLDFLVRHRCTFTSRLAGLTRVSFNPFAFIQQQSSSGMPFRRCRQSQVSRSGPAGMAPP